MTALCDSCMTIVIQCRKWRIVNTQFVHLDTSRVAKFGRLRCVISTERVLRNQQMDEQMQQDVYEFHQVIE